MIADPLGAFRADPTGSAVLLDVDGTLAPIAAHPSESRVSEATLASVRRLVERMGLVGCISGRGALDAARLVPVEGVAFAGNHGLEVLEHGVLHVAPAVDPWLPALRDLAWRLTPIAAGTGAWIEDKGATLAIHYRQARDPQGARDRLEAEALPLARAAGLEARFGRQVLELRPPVALDKGTAVQGLLAGRGLARSLYAGDDTTDLDAFRVVDVAIAVSSPEAPPALLRAADLVVAGTEELVALLDSLSR